MTFAFLADTGDWNRDAKVCAEECGVPSKEQLRSSGVQCCGDWNPVYYKFSVISVCLHWYYTAHFFYLVKCFSIPNKFVSSKHKNSSPSINASQVCDLSTDFEFVLAGLLSGTTHRISSDKSCIKIYTWPRRTRVKNVSLWCKDLNCWGIMVFPTIFSFWSKVIILNILDASFHFENVMVHATSLTIQRVLLSTV